jgi:hypothetical protein
VSRWGSGLFASWGRAKGEATAKPATTDTSSVNGSGADQSAAGPVETEPDGSAAPAEAAAPEQSTAPVPAEDSSKKQKAIAGPRKPGLWRSLHSLPSRWAAGTYQCPPPSP